uniref:Uncharacterized protein n=1 Tax=Moniliophthora roreri TaxID=221103 RepID=A0A0W0FHQ0_MONRR
MAMTGPSVTPPAAANEGSARLDVLPSWAACHVAPRDQGL